jgi:MerR family transcriptional regulator, light-induced transcriptional regulator
MLGARVPTTALRAAVRRTGPAVVLVWSHALETAAVSQLVALGGDPSRPMVLAAAGPGWDAASLPPTVLAPGSLAEAVELIRSAVR